MAPPRKGGRFKRPRRKVCNFCVEKMDIVDYKLVTRLRRYLTDRGKIVPRGTSGNCAKHQRLVASAIKRARQVALLPFIAR